MLQQTRVEAVIPYYTRFLERFPTIEALAAAPEKDVLTAWSGLGYYRRVRHLQLAAKQVSAAGLPFDYESIHALPGIGQYTAAAVASIVYGLPHAAVDGNVSRVIHRLTNNGLSGLSAIRIGAERLLDRKRPGDFNQAMMELGARVCTPRSPDCDHCPVERFCGAHHAGAERLRSLKPVKTAPRVVSLHVAVLEREGCVFLIERDGAARRLAHFHELPLKKQISGARSVRCGGFRHRIVNDLFQVTVWRMRAFDTLPPGKWYSLEKMRAIPLTTITRKALALISKQPG